MGGLGRLPSNSSSVLSHSTPPAIIFYRLNIDNINESSDNPKPASKHAI
jgi:hypothetical protein